MNGSPNEGKPRARQAQPMKASGMRRHSGETGKISLGRKEGQNYKKRHGAGNENTAQVDDWKETSLTAENSW